MRKPSPRGGEGLVGGPADEASPKGEGEGVAPYPEGVCPPHPTPSPSGRGFRAALCRRRPEGAGEMSRAKLLAWQAGVGLAMLLLWHVLTVYPIIGAPRQIQFFFSTPVDVLARVWREFASGEIWYHLYITLL